MRFYFLSLATLFVLFSCTSKTTSQTAQAVPQVIEEKAEKIVKVDINIPEGKIEKIEKSEEEWKSELSETEYYILREKGTERAGTGDLLDNKKEGVYICAACQLPLFSSETKFESGTGWPSFYIPIDPRTVAEEVDNKYGMKRTEVLCARCDGHLGHVFTDGPKPTGLRYCINAVSLDFVQEKQP